MDIFNNLIERTEWGIGGENTLVCPKTWSNSSGNCCKVQSGFQSTAQTLVLAHMYQTDTD